MSYTLKHIYIKPNADIDVNFWSGDILNLIDTYFDAGKITQKPVKTTDGSTDTFTTIFKDKASFDEFMVDNISTTNKSALETFCDENEVICNIETSF